MSYQFYANNKERAQIIAMLQEALPHCPDIMRSLMQSELSTLGVS